MNYIDITSPDINNGLGCRVTLWVSGCPFHCKGCHNKETWDFKYGKPYDVTIHEQVINALAPSYIKGLTLSGGDPLSQNLLGLIQIKDLIKDIKDIYPEKDIWIYSGSTYEELIRDNQKRNILSYCDVLVDGPYIQEQRDITLPFRGSKNQRLIDLNETRKQNKIVELDIE